MAPGSLLDRIEQAGNRLPHPTLLFVYLCALVLVLSWLAAMIGTDAVHPLTGETLLARNLLSRDGLQQILAETVSNFVLFAPVGTVLVAVLGIGVAEHSGLIGAVLRATIMRAPKRLLSFFLVSAGVLSSLAADSGYVILIPLAAMVFLSAGRHPVVGIAAAFAGVSGGFSANLLIGPLDAILAGISTEAAHLVAPEYQVSAAGNYYFIVASTLLIGVVGSWVTEKIVDPRFTRSNGPPAEDSGGFSRELSGPERRGLLGVAAFSALFVLLLLWGLLPADGFLRDPMSGTVLQGPFIKGIVSLIAFYAAISGILYGRLSGSYQSSSSFVAGMEQHMAAMAGYLVLMFFAAQFVSYFAWSNLGSIVAVQGAALLQHLSLPPVWLLLCFILLTALINLFVGSASAKWALLAPIFVPMLLLVGLSPEASQMAFRIGDSSTNIITPLMPYFGVVVAFAQKYQKDIGIGTLIATMLPYSIAFLLSWTALLLIWTWFGWPLGPGAPILLPPV